MTSEEHDLITGLFDRLRQADTGPKDQEADQLIGQLTTGQPGAPYRLVQTLLVQEHALNNATVRIKQLEQQVAQAQPAAGSSAGQTQGSGGGFLSGLFGHHSTTAAPQSLPIPPQQLPQQSSQAYVQSAPPYPSTVTMAPSAGSGFLRGALQTAAGVAGGSLLVDGLESLLGHHAGPFGGFGGGGGFFGGGGYGGGGFGGGGNIVENNTTEVINNYGDERGGGSFLGSGGGEPGHQETQREDNRGDTASSGNLDDSSFNTGNPFDAPTGDSGGSGLAMDNTFDTDNTDANDGGGGNDFGGDLAGDDSGGGSSDDNLA